MIRSTLTVSLLGALLLISGCRTPAGGTSARTENASSPDRIAGMWRCESYELAGGTIHPLDGNISFSDPDWMVLFFVLDDEGQARRGSGEGGTYTLQGDRLVFTHRRILSVGEAIGSLPEAPLRMEVSGAGGIGNPEACSVEFAGDRMTIHFPSGNRIRFTRTH